MCIRGGCCVKKWQSTAWTRSLTEENWEASLECKTCPRARAGTPHGRRAGVVGQLCLERRSQGGERCGWEVHNPGLERV